MADESRAGQKHRRSGSGRRAREHRGITSLASALELAIVLWIAFPVVLLVGSVTQENVPWKLGAIHAGDWLAKLVIISIIVTLWR
jgi:hypothetical protein